MNYSVKTTAYFDKEAKRIAKKHKGIKLDIAKLIDSLEIIPPLAPILVKTFIK